MNLKVYNPNPNLNNNLNNQKINIDDNINSLDEGDKINNIEQSDNDFVIINHEDFEKVFFKGKNKNEFY